jgi:hypothetical protein
LAGHKMARFTITGALSALIGKRYETRPSVLIQRERLCEQPHRMAARPPDSAGFEFSNSPDAQTRPMRQLLLGQVHTFAVGSQHITEDPAHEALPEALANAGTECPARHVVHPIYRPLCSSGPLRLVTSQR